MYPDDDKYNALCPFPACLGNDKFWNQQIEREIIRLV